MKCHLHCFNCKSYGWHRIKKLDQQIQYEDNELKGECVLYSKKCLACNEISFIEVSLLEWIHLKKRR